MSRPKLGELLVDAGVIDEMQLESALGEQGNWGKRLGQTLLELGVLDEETLVRTLARQLAIPVVWLRGKRIKPEIVALLPDDFIQKHRCLPVLLDERAGKTLVLAMEDPCDLDVIDAATYRSQIEVRPALAAPSELDDAIDRHVAPDPNDSCYGTQFAQDEETTPPDLVRMTTDPSVPPPDEEQSGPSSQAILKALTQLLVEKDVFTREELIERLGALADE